jgi:hypothetical protein
MMTANGFVDDFRGWDFVASAAGAAGEDLATPEQRPEGLPSVTARSCAGMADATTNNGVGVAGPGFKSKIMPGARAGTMARPAAWSTSRGARRRSTTRSRRARTSSTARGRTARCRCSTPAVGNAIAKGVTVCVAAGNDNTQSQAQNYLTTRGDCVDVAATDINDQRASFSNFGSWIDVSAAGQSVTSTYSNH